MKNTIKSLIIAGCISLVGLNSSHGQFGGFAEMMAGGLGDAEQIMTEYMRPFANSLGANLNSGWYNSAKVHSTLGFDITFTTSFAFAPDDALSYDLDELTLNALYTDNMAPTFFGDIAPPTLRYEENVPGVGDVQLAEFSHPKGLGISFFPSPMINAGVGLPKGFEIRGRYMPTVKVQGIELGVWGIGFKHDIGQWIPFVKRLPVLDFTIQYGYTNVDVYAKPDPITPGDLQSQDNTTAAVDWNTQEFKMISEGHTANFLVGATLPVVAFYGGVGISISGTGLNMNGWYPVPVMNVSDPLNPFSEVTDASAEKDPINIDIKNADGSTTAPRFNAGIRFKFTVVTLHFDYTYANYSVATAGLGISFR